ncbi:MAG: peptidase S16, partial [Frankiales bacterium]|nr:peptidase S16 [Frankiales bacterium]
MSDRLPLFPLGLVLLPGLLLPLHVFEERYRLL